MLQIKMLSSRCAIRRVARYLLLLVLILAQSQILCVLGWVSPGFQPSTLTENRAALVLSRGRFPSRRYQIVDAIIEDSDSSYKKNSNWNGGNVNNSTSSSSSTSSTQLPRGSVKPPPLYDLGVGKNQPKSFFGTPTAIGGGGSSRSAATTTGGTDRLMSPPPTTTTTATAQAVPQPHRTPPPPPQQQQQQHYSVAHNWMVPEAVIKPHQSVKVGIKKSAKTTYKVNTIWMNNHNVQKAIPADKKDQMLPDESYQYAPSPPLPRRPITTRRMVARDNEAQLLRGALWDERHYDGSSSDRATSAATTDKRSNAAAVDKSSVATIHDNVNNNLDDSSSLPTSVTSTSPPKQSMTATTSSSYDNAPPYPKAFYPDIDLSIPDTVYSDDGSIDLVWDLMRWEVYQNQQEQYEPLLVSFLHSTILNHATLESSLAFLLANRLQSPAMMISTQLQALLLSTLQECPSFRRKVRADIMAVRDRDPACHTLPDVFLYFKGFHALQSHRAAHVLWNTNRTVLAQYLQSQVSQIFQIDIHPNATIGSGIMLDHGTGIVIGETATIGHNCSILHHVTLGGSGKKGVVRHPAVGNGVLLGAGATVLGPVSIGDGSQVGAGTLVISDLPAHCVAVGVPARIIGSFVDVTEQPSIGMNQIMEDRENMITFESDGI